MKCIYCHAASDAPADRCPDCGLPISDPYLQRKLQDDPFPGPPSTGTRSAWVSVGLAAALVLGGGGGYFGAGKLKRQSPARPAPVSAPSEPVPPRAAGEAVALILPWPLVEEPSAEEVDTLTMALAPLPERVRPWSGPAVPSLPPPPPVPETTAPAHLMAVDPFHPRMSGQVFVWELDTRTVQVLPQADPR